MDQAQKSGRIYRRSKSFWTTPFPRVDEISDSIVRYKERFLDGLELDAVGHSMGGLFLNMIRLQEMDLFRKVCFMETNPVFEASTTLWRVMIKDITWSKFLGRLAKCDIMYLAEFTIWTDLKLQHVLKHCLYFFEWCDREENFDSEKILFLIAESDHYIPPQPVIDYLATEARNVQVFTYPGIHGSGVVDQIFPVVRRLAEFFNDPESNTEVA